MLAPTHHMPVEPRSGNDLQVQTQARNHENHANSPGPATDTLEPASPRLDGSAADYQVGKAIGKGKFSIVYKATALRTGQPCALKKVAVFDTMDEKARDKCLKEVRLLRTLEHPNIIAYLDSFVHDRELVIVFDWADGGDLKRSIRRARECQSPFSEATIWGIFAQICCGIEYMHVKRIMHRDLKPANIFLMSNGTVRIGDLGLGRFFSDQTLAAFSKVGTPLYMSPEVLKAKGYDWKSDVWSLGCILYELAALRSPFKEQGLNLYGLFQKINKGVYPALDPENGTFSPELLRMVDSMIQVDPKVRPGVSQIHIRACAMLDACTSGDTSEEDRVGQQQQQQQQQQMDDHDTYIRRGGGRPMQNQGRVRHVRSNQSEDEQQQQQQQQQQFHHQQQQQQKQQPQQRQHKQRGNPQVDQSPSPNQRTTTRNGQPHDRLEEPHQHQHQQQQQQQEQEQEREHRREAGSRLVAAALNAHKPRRPRGLPLSVVIPMANETIQPRQQMNNNNKNSMSRRQVDDTVEMDATNIVNTCTDVGQATRSACGAAAETSLTKEFIGVMNNLYRSNSAVNSFSDNNIINNINDIHDNKNIIKHIDSKNNNNVDDVKNIDDDIIHNQIGKDNSCKNRNISKQQHNVSYKNERISPNDNDENSNHHNGVMLQQQLEPTDLHGQQPGPITDSIRHVEEQHKQDRFNHEQGQQYKYVNQECHKQEQHKQEQNKQEQYMQKQPKQDQLYKEEQLKLAKLQFKKQQYQNIFKQDQQHRQGQQTKPLLSDHVIIHPNTSPETIQNQPNFEQHGRISTTTAPNRATDVPADMILKQSPPSRYMSLPSPVLRSPNDDIASMLSSSRVASIADRVGEKLKLLNYETRIYESMRSDPTTRQNRHRHSRSLRFHSPRFAKLDQTTSPSSSSSTKNNNIMQYQDFCTLAQWLMGRLRSPWKFQENETFDDIENYIKLSTNENENENVDDMDQMSTNVTDISQKTTSLTARSSELAEITVRSNESATQRVSHMGALVNAMQSLGLDPHTTALIRPASLISGHGPVVCFVLDWLTDAVLEVENFTLMRRVHEFKDLPPSVVVYDDAVVMNYECRQIDTGVFGGASENIKTGLHRTCFNKDGSGGGLHNEDDSDSDVSNCSERDVNMRRTRRRRRKGRWGHIVDDDMTVLGYDGGENRNVGRGPNAVEGGRIDLDKLLWRPSARAWYSEAELLAPRLRARTRQVKQERALESAFTWRDRLSALKEHAVVLNSFAVNHAPNVREIAERIKSQLVAVQKREVGFERSFETESKQYARLIKPMGKLKREIQNLEEKLSKEVVGYQDICGHTETVEVLLETTKNAITDTKPLVDMKKALKKIKNDNFMLNAKLGLSAARLERLRQREEQERGGMGS